jgi:Uma2 family endonuclease
MRLAHSAREPDLLFVAAARRHLLDQQRLNGPADLVVEIVSPESAARDRADKFDEYQGAGVREYWVVDVREGKERVDFWLLAEDGRYRAALPDGAGVYRSTVLGGFWLDTAWLWQEPLPSALATFAVVANLPDAVRAALGAGPSSAT